MIFKKLKLSSSSIISLILTYILYFLNSLVLAI